VRRGERTPDDNAEELSDRYEGVNAGLNDVPLADGPQGAASVLLGVQRVCERAPAIDRPAAAPALAKIPVNALPGGIVATHREKQGAG
jgi:hypothetical protein